MVAEVVHNLSRNFPHVAYEVVLFGLKQTNGRTCRRQEHVERQCLCPLNTKTVDRKFSHSISMLIMDLNQSVMVCCYWQCLNCSLYSQSCIRFFASSSPILIALYHSVSFIRQDYARSACPSLQSIINTPCLMFSSSTSTRNLKQLGCTYGLRNTTQ